MFSNKILFAFPALDYTFAIKPASFKLIIKKKDKYGWLVNIFSIIAVNGIS